METRQIEIKVEDISKVIKIEFADVVKQEINDEKKRRNQKNNNKKYK